MIKSLWASVQGDPVFMRRVNGWLTMFWLAMIPVSLATGWVKASFTCPRFRFGPWSPDTGRRGRPLESRSPKPKSSGVKPTPTSPMRSSRRSLSPRRLSLPSAPFRLLQAHPTTLAQWNGPAPLVVAAHTRRPRRANHRPQASDRRASFRRGSFHQGPAHRGSFLTFGVGAGTQLRLVEPRASSSTTPPSPYNRRPWHPSF